MPPSEEVCGVGALRPARATILGHASTIAARTRSSHSYRAWSLGLFVYTKLCVTYWDPPLLYPQEAGVNGCGIQNDYVKCIWLRIRATELGVYAACSRSPTTAAGTEENRRVAAEKSQEPGLWQAED